MADAGSNTGFVFRSEAFNTTVEREYFVNPCCFGDDTARWLISRLRQNGYATDTEPGQEDFGWYFGFEACGVRHVAIIGFRPGEDGEPSDWLCWLEREAGLIASMLGRQKNVRPEAVAAIQQTLAASDIITNLRTGPEKDL